MKQRYNKTSSIFTFENLFGLILAVLIIFQILPSVSLSNSLNNPIGVISGLILVIVFFVLMNPIVGFLLLIYFYEIIQQSNKFNKQMKPITRNKQLQQMNSKPQSMELEQTVIKSMAPIVNENQGNNASYIPVLEKIEL